MEGNLSIQCVQRQPRQHEHLFEPLAHLHKEDADLDVGTRACRACAPRLRRLRSKKARRKRKVSFLLELPY